MSTFIPVNVKCPSFGIQTPFPLLSCLAMYCPKASQMDSCMPSPSILSFEWLIDEFAFSWKDLPIRARSFKPPLLSVSNLKHLKKLGQFILLLNKLWLQFTDGILNESYEILKCFSYSYLLSPFLVLIFLILYYEFVFGLLLPPLITSLLA